MPDLPLPQALQLAEQRYVAGDLAQAESICRQILAQDSRSAGALHGLGLIAFRRGQHKAAADLLEQAIALAPANAIAHCNLGTVYQSLQQPDRALACFKQSLRLKDDALTHYNLATVLQSQGRLDEAITSFRKAIALKPDYAPAHNNLGSILEELGQLDAAVGCFQKALSLKPDYAGALVNLGNALMGRGQLDQSIAHYRQALAVQGDFSIAHDCLLYALQFHPESTPQSLLKESQAWAKQHADPLAQEILPHPNDSSPDRRLKIGYVSPDYRFHSAASFLLPLLSHHDPKEVEVFCYSNVARPDPMTHRLRNLSHQWRDVSLLSDSQLAQQIRSDRIDILVDLTLHMAHNRLLTFARKPAPIQVTWLGYPGTTGLSSIDYRLTDPYLDPPGQGDEFYSERSIRLPHTFWCYQPTIDTPEVNPLPALSSGYITFGCFNNFAKVTEEALRLWIEVLKAVPTSHLLLQTRQGSHRQRVRRLFEKSVIAPERLEMIDRVPQKDYFPLHHRIDIALDPIPYPGHTTALDGFWMGVPVVTLAGSTAVSRGSASMLSNLGFKELIAYTKEEYVSIAADLASALPKLATLRSTLRERMQQSPLMDAKSFARDLESEYRRMWRRWCEVQG